MSKGIQFKNEQGEKMYSNPHMPIGSIYLSVNNTNPSKWFGGKWEKISTGRVLMGASSDSQLGTTVDSGLPNITGYVTPRWSDSSGQGMIMAGGYGGALYTSYSGTENWWSKTTEMGGNRDDRINFDASRMNSIYGKSSIVQPPAFYCYIWCRVA